MATPASDPSLTAAAIQTPYRVEFVERIRADIAALPQPLQAHSVAFAKHALLADKLTLSKAYRTRLSELCAALGADELRDRAGGWLAGIATLPHLDWEAYRQHTGDYPSMGADPQLLPLGVNVTRALALAHSYVEGSGLSGSPERLAKWGARTVKGSGPRSMALFYAGIRTLSSLHDAEAGAAALGRIYGAVPRPSLRKKLDKELARVAKRLGVEVVDLVEQTTADHGLHDGQAEHPIGDYTAVITVDSPGKSSVSWRTTTGKSQRSTPASLKQDSAAELTGLKAKRKQLDTDLAAQASRLESYFLNDRTWPLAAFAKTYLEHGLLGWLAKRLVWSISADADGWDAATAVWTGDVWRHSDGTALTPAAASYVRLWHPVAQPATLVKAWSAWLDASGTVQPFPQVRRAVYVPTQTELQQRAALDFVGQTAPQSRLRAACRKWGWQMGFFGGFDAGSEGQATMPIAAHGLTAAIELRIAGEVEHNAIAQRLESGPLVFRDSERRAVALDAFPARVYSEVVRSARGLFGL